LYACVTVASLAMGVSAHSPARRACAEALYRRARGRAARAHSKAARSPGKKNKAIMIRLFSSWGPPARGADTQHNLKAAPPPAGLGARAPPGRIAVATVTDVLCAS
jgi:hypothetical protein